MSPEFHQVLRDFARRKADEIFGAGDVAESNAEAMADHRQYIVREKKRMIASIQAARIAYQARMIF